ncbi:MAG: alpha/beta hydrolase fold domain-containing protein [Sphingobacteriaceae bacterium]
MKIKFIKGFLVLSIIFAVSACKKNEVEDEPLKAEELIDVAYGEHEANTFDVYLPEERGDTTKVIFLLHGGWWIEGDKDSLTQHAMSLRDSGFAVVNMNYRLADTSINIHPAQQHDIVAAINFVSSKAFEWKISSDKYGLLGVSAGAHLALLYTYGYNSDNKIKTVVSISGPTNFMEVDFNDPALAPAIAAVDSLLGGPFDPLNPSVYIQASPIARVSSLSKPTLILHGADDLIVPPSQAEALAAKLELLGVEHRIEASYPKDHELVDASNAQEIYGLIVHWLRDKIK